MKKALLSLIIFCLLSQTYPPPITAEENDDPPNVLVVYTENERLEENQKKLDLLLSHFTNNIEFVKAGDYHPELLNGITHLFYQGDKETELPAPFTDSLNDFQGTMVAFGRNVNQLGHSFDFLTPLKEENFNYMYLTDRPTESIKVDIQSVLNVNHKENAEVLAFAKAGHVHHPLVTKFKNNYYVGTSVLMSPFSIILGEILHDVFQTDHEQENPGYIRLEDIHPMVDPIKLKQVADILKEKGIPYMIAVIPVYVNPETGEEIHMSDSPKVLEVLKYMQKNGGSVVLHGYTHQYRKTETGEGFEFWDVKNNTPVYKEAEDTRPLKSPEDFKSDEAYQNYMTKLKSFETQYITDKVEKGIEEMVGFGLHPLAFEAPHYTMSQNGYHTLSRHFNTYVGQVQLSDRNWEIMDGAPYVTSPSFLKGMTLLPETLGYVEPDNPDAIPEIIQKAENQLLLRDGMVSVFYHPYLGAERFEQLLNQLEKYPIEWIDLKKRNITVQSSDVTIQTNQGNVLADQSMTASIFFSKLSFQYFVSDLVEKITWAMAGTGSLAVVFFTGYTITSRRRLVKEERRDRVG